MEIGTALLGIAVGAGMIGILPLMVWGGTGDWRRALQALKEYVSLFFWGFVIFGGLGAWMALMEYIDKR